MTVDERFRFITSITSRTSGPLTGSSSPEVEALKDR